MPEGHKSDNGHNGSSRTHDEHNFSLGVINGSLGKLGMRLIDPHLVMGAFVYQVTRSPALVGLLSALTFAGALWPQLYMSSIMEHENRKKPYYIGALVARVLTLICLTGTMWMLGQSNNVWFVIIFFCAWFFLRSAQGAGAMPFLDMVGKSIHSRRLGSFFAMRNLFGEGMALLAGFFVAQPILAAFDMPINYVTLAVVGTVLMTVAWVVWTFSHEPAEDDPPEKRNVREMLAAGWRLLKRDRNYRALLGIRSLMRINVLTLVFYVPYGIEKLGTVGMAGVFVGCIAASRLLSSPLWAWISRSQGNRRILLLVSILFAFSPFLAFIASRFPAIFSVHVPWLAFTLDFPLCIYLLALALMGMALSGNIVGTNSFMLECAPSKRRASYIAFLNTITFPLAFSSMVVGLALSFLAGMKAPLGILGVWFPAMDVAPQIGGMEVLLWICVGAGLATCVAALQLSEQKEPITS